MGKLVVGPAFNALAKGARRMMQREAAVETATVLPKTAQATRAAIQEAQEAAAAKAAKAEQEAIVEAAAKASRDPQTGKVNDKSISEAATITQAEEAGMVQNPRRPDTSKGKPNLDFAVDGPEPYKYCDVKTPVEPGKFRNTSVETQAERIVENIKMQKAGSNDVLHIVDLKNVPVEARADFKTQVLDRLGSSEGVKFIND